MQDSDRRTFLQHSLGVGAVSLWAGQGALADEVGASLTASNAGDKIDKVELFRIKSIKREPHIPFLWVRISTARGLVGFGECYAVETTERWLLDYMKSLEGRSVSNLINGFYLEALAGYDPSQSHRLNMGWCSAVSCLEIALWDILGKMANLPIHSLLGGAIRDRVPLYANHAIFVGEGPSQHERILHAKELGFEMFKWDPFLGAPTTEKEIRRQLEPVERARDALGPDFKIAIDAHARWGDLESPKLVAKAMEPLDITFFEEPFSHDRIAWHVELAKSTSIPLASGEHMTHLREVRDLVSSSGIRYFQPEAGNLGGIAACQKACAFAALYDVGVASHNWCGPLSTLATLQFTSVIPNLFRQEWPHLAYGERWETEVVHPHLVPEQGYLRVPDGPGIGAAPDMDKLSSLELLI